MNTIFDTVTNHDLTRLTRDILEDIATDLNIPTDMSMKELAQMIWALIREDAIKRQRVLLPFQDQILAGKTSVTWYTLTSARTLTEARNNLINNCGFALFNEIRIPSANEVTSTPRVIGGFMKGERDYFLRLIHKSGLASFNSGNEIITVPTSLIKTVYINEEQNFLEVRTESRSSNKFARKVTELLGADFSFVPVDVMRNFENNIERVADALNGELIDATARPGIVLETLDEQQVTAIVNILAALNEFFQDEQIESLSEALLNARERFDDNLITIPFMALVLSGLERIGMGVTDRDLRTLPSYSLFRPHIENQGGFIRFSISENGITNTYTVRVGLESKSVYFLTPASETAISYVREALV